MSYPNLLRAVILGTILLLNEVAWGQCPAITLTPMSLAAGQQGAAYGPVPVTATGGTTPIAFSATGLPAGMSISTTGPAVAQVSGTPNVSGTFSVRITARDARSCLGRRILPLVIAPGVAPAITSATSTAFIVGQANSFTVTATGTPPPTLSQTGTLPSGVTFVVGTGVLSGTPASGTGGTYNLTFAASNGILPNASQNFTLTVNETPSVSGGPFSLAENSLDATVVGTVTVTDPHAPAQTHTWSITGGNTGGAFAIDSSGQLTVATSAALNFETTPSFSLTVQATDNGTPVLSGSATITVNLTNVNEGPTAVSDTITVPEGGTATTLTTPAGATSVRQNDTDPDAGDTLTVTTTPVSAPTNGSLTLNADGTFSYTHDGSETTTDSFVYEICDPGLLCATATVFITITASNDAPVLTAGGTLAYTENDPATALDPTVTVADADDVNLESATVQITGNYQTGQDVLAFIDTATITGVFTPASGLLTMSGPDTLANYEAALRSVTYVNTAETPSTTARTVTWRGNDGTSLSAVVTSTITVAAVNDVPVVDLNGPGAGIDYAATFTEGTPAVIVDGAALTVTDLDHANLASATVTLTNIQNAGVETLTATPTGSITVNYVAPTLTLSGSDTLANYQQVLRTVTYNNTAPNPNPTARSVTFVVNDGTDPSATATSTVTVNAINAAPSFTLPGNPAAVNEDAGAQTVNGFATTISDGDGNTQTLTFNVTNNTNTALFSGGPAISATGVLTYTPAANAFGTATLTITLSDNGGTANGGVDTSAPQNFTITVNAVNDAPSFTASPPPTVNEDAGAQSVAGWATFNPGNAQESTQTVVGYTVGSVSNGALFSVQPSVATNGTLSYTPAANASGTSTFQVTVQDNGGTANGGVDTSVAQSFTITVNGVNDAPSFAAGPDQTVNEDAGAQTVNPWATAINDGDPDVAQTLTFNVTNNTNPGLFSTGPAISATGVLTYTPTANANGGATITLRVQDNGGTANGGVDISPTQSFTITVNPVNDPPVARTPAPSYTGNANLTFTMLNDGGDGAGGILDLLDGATDPDGATTITVVAGTFATANGGSVTVAADGSFTYLPPAGLVGNDTFGYQLRDDGIPGVATTNVTATIALNDLDGAGANTNVLWFIDEDATASSNIGTQANPFRTLAAFNAANTGVGNNPADTDFIFIGDDAGGDNNGDGAGSYGGGITLRNNQRLIGDGASSTLAGITGISLGSFNSLAAFSGVRPTIANSAGNAIALGSGNTLRGLNLGNTPAANFSISGTVVGTLTVSEALINNATGGGVNVGTSGALNVTLDSVTASGGTNGINLVGTTGTFTANGGSLQNASGADVRVSGGTSTVTYTGTITDDVGVLVDISGTTGGTKTFSGGITDGNDGDGNGITLTSNSGATINFSGGVTLSTGANAAFTATGGGTVTVTGTTNTLTTTTATALNVANTTIGAIGLTFQSISANGGANGIVLNTTGVGGLTVTGTGATDGSGGTIQNTTTRGASFISARNITLNNMNFTNACTADFPAAPTGLSTGVNTGDNAVIHLQAVTNATLNNLNLTTSAEQGINGHNVNGFTLTDSVLSGLGNGPDEDGIHFFNMSGVSAITNTTITSSGDDNVIIQNNTNLTPISTVGTLTITGGSFNTAGASGLLFGIRGTSNTTINISGVTTANNFSGGIVADVFDTAVMDLQVTGTTSNSNNDQLSASAGDNSVVDLDADGNTLSSPNAADFIVVGLLGSAFDNGFVFDTRLQNNTITTGNGRTADGLFVFNAGGGAMNVATTNNTIDYAGTQRAILLQSGQDGPGAINATVTNNDIDIELDGAGNAVAGMLAQAAITSPTGDGASVCADIGGAGALSNVFTHSLGGGMAGGDIRVRQRLNGTMRLPGYAGAATDTAAVVTYLAGRNTVVSASTATADSTGFAGGAACTQPTIP